MAVSEASESNSSDMQACRLLGLNVPEELGFGADLSDAFSCTSHLDITAFMLNNGIHHGILSYRIATNNITQIASFLGGWLLVLTVALLAAKNPEEDPGAGCESVAGVQIGMSSVCCCRGT